MKTVEQSFLELGRKDGEYKTRGAAIFAKCFDCCAYSRTEVDNCPSTACWLWPYRNPKAARATSKALHPDRKPRKPPTGGLEALRRHRELAKAATKTSL